MIARFLRVFRALARPAAVESDMQAEMQAHVEQSIARLMERGLGRQEAEREARREFGNIAAIQNQARDARGTRWWDELRQDVRYGFRGLRSNSGFAAVAIASMVLGIGVNTSIFTVIKLAMDPGTIPDAASFAYIPGNWSMPAAERLRAGAPALGAVIARSQESVVITVPGAAAPSPASLEFVSNNFFATLGGPMLLGRAIGSGAAATDAVISYRFWERHFGGDSSAVGKHLRIGSGTTLRVIGVASRDVSGVRRTPPDLWAPLALRPLVPAVSQRAPSHGNWFSAADHHWLTLYGRLRSGQRPSAVNAELNQVIRALSIEDSAQRPVGFEAGPIVVKIGGNGLNGAGERLAAVMILAATFIVLLIACVNVASLMLARGAARQREIAVRLSLGAGRQRLVRQLLTESIVLALIGGGLAVIASAAVLQIVAVSGALEAIGGGDPERLARSLRPDAWVLLYATVAAVTSALAFGVVPALRATRTDLVSAAKGDTTSFGRSLARGRLRSGLVVCQVALSTILLAAAGLLGRSVTRALSIDTGFDRSAVVSASFGLTMGGYDTTRARVFLETLEARLASAPGIDAIGRGDMPLAQRSRARFILGREGREHDGYFNTVTSGYFATMRIAIVRGRAFSDAEVRARLPLVVLSETTARRLWPDGNALGKVITVEPSGKSAIPGQAGAFASARVIGIARDAQMTELGSTPSIYAYLPGRRGGLLVRGESVDAVQAAVRDVARSIDPQLHSATESLDHVLRTRTSLAAAPIAAAFAIALGALSLLLATVGIFGLVAYSVAQRQRELAIRSALGAHSSAIVRLIMRDGLRVVAVGCGIGLVLAMASGRLLASLLFGMSSLDAITYAGSMGTLMAVALLASYLPARRAGRTDPAMAMRAE